MRVWSIVIAALLGSLNLAQESPTAIHGRWTATAGPTQVFRGRWVGQTLPDRPNEAHGSWSLFNEAGEVAMEGTWSAQKTRMVWEGTWTARTHLGRAVSGTWTAQIPDQHGRTLQDMLAWTIEREIGGSWRSGRYQGQWWLKGSPSQVRTR
jgi:hypothetical protein